MKTMEWSDMSDAPTDGTPILIWDLHSGEPVIVTWMAGEEAWGVEDAHGIVAAVERDVRPAAWTPVPPTPAIPFKPRVRNLTGHPAWRSMSTAPRDGTVVLTWHPRTGRALLVLWDLGCYAERRGWCMESASREKWEAEPRHGEAIAWMVVPGPSGDEAHNIRRGTLLDAA